MKRFGVLAAAALCCVALLAGCGGGSGGSDSDSPYIIGERGITVKDPAQPAAGQKAEDVQPYVYSITPTSGPRAGGTPVTIKGKNFLKVPATNPTAAKVVSVGGKYFVDVVWVDDETITAVTPSVNVIGANPVLAANAYGDNSFSDAAQQAYFTFIDPNQ